MVFENSTITGDVVNISAGAPVEIFVVTTVGDVPPPPQAPERKIRVGYKKARTTA